MKYYTALDDLKSPLLALKSPASKPNFALLADSTSVVNPPALFPGKDAPHVVQMKFIVKGRAAGFALSVTGGKDQVVNVDGAPYVAGKKLPANASVDVCFLVGNGAQYPLTVGKVQGTKVVPFNVLDVHHD